MEDISMVTAVSSVKYNNDRWLPILTKAGVYGYPGSRQKTVHREVAQSGSASGLGPEGRRFESCLPDHLSKKISLVNYLKQA